MSSPTVEQRNRVATLLEQVADGSVSATEALARTEEWKDVSWRERAFEDAYHALRHFDADTDIRKKDLAYASSQVVGLRSLAAKLRGTA